MYVFPIFSLKKIGDYREQSEENQHINTDMVSLQFNRLAEVNQEIGEIAHGGIIFHWTHRAGFFQLKMIKYFFLHNIFFFFSVRRFSMNRSFFSAEYRALAPLPFIEDMRHGDMLKHDIIPAARRFILAVKTAQIG